MQPTLKRTSENWSKTSQETLKLLIEKYGEPDEFSASQAIWYNNAPWKQTIVRSKEIPHDFPVYHNDVLEQFINYRVPVDKYDDLACYVGSIIVEPARGVISTLCAGEAMNFVALNLAHDIVTGQRTVEEACEEYVRLYQAYHNGQRPPATQGFLFDPPDSSIADPHVEIING